MTSSPVLDPDILEPAALLMFKRLTFAEGVLEMPCVPSLLDEQMTLLKDLLLVLHQKPPQTMWEDWREKIAAKLDEGYQMEEPQRLVLHYEPYDPLVGLTGGFSLRFALKPAEPITYQQLNMETASSYEVCRHMSLAWGEILFPCVPKLLPEIIRLMRKNLSALGHELTDDDIVGYHRLLGPKLNEWFEDNSNSRLLFRYSPLEPSLGLWGGVKIELISRIHTIEDNYSRWAETRTGALFGEYCDAKVMTAAQEIAQGQEPGSVRILDVGAGTGRDTFPLARAGFQVDALELTQVLAQHMVERSQIEGVDVWIINGDFLNREIPLEPQSYDLVFLSEVIATHFRSIGQVRQALIRMCELVKVGGQILFDIFLCVPEYEPTLMIRQLSLVYWTYVITPAELEEALVGMPLELISNESSFEFERDHTPPEHWPPTGWFENWATGRNLFPISSRPPLELRWLLYRRLSGDPPSE